MQGVILNPQLVDGFIHDDAQLLDRSVGLLDGIYRRSKASYLENIDLTFGPPTLCFTQRFELFVLLSPQLPSEQQVKIQPLGRSSCCEPAVARSLRRRALGMWDDGTGVENRL